MRKRLRPEDFVVAWERSRSLTEVSVRLVRDGHPDMTPRRVLMWASVLKQAGTRLKKIGRPKMPARVKATEKVLAFTPGMGKTKDMNHLFEAYVLATLKDFSRQGGGSGTSS